METAPLKMDQEAAKNKHFRESANRYVLHICFAEKSWNRLVGVSGFSRASNREHANTEWATRGYCLLNN